MESAGEFRWSVNTGLPAHPPTAGTGRLDSVMASSQVVGGQFQLLGPLGSGGMGRVFRARDVHSGREVALKFLHGRPSPKALERFRREGELTAALDHPGIVRIHGGGEHDGRPYLVYELIEPCRDLSEVLHDQPPPRTIPLLLEVAQALAQAHAQGVVHRDLKPSNVLIDGQGHARVADFGVAAATWQERLTQTGGVVGTPPYMSPEMWSSAAGELGPAADVWALGVLLYEALCGQHPFPARTVLEQEARVLHAQPKPVEPPVSRALEAVVQRALAKSPRDRFPDAGAFAGALEAAWDGGQGLIPPRGPSLATRVALGLALSALLGGAGLVALRPAARTTSSDAPASPPSAAPTRLPPPPEGAALEGHPLLTALAAGEPLAALQAELARGGGEPAPLGPVLLALRADPPAQSVLEGAPPPLRVAAAAWLLGEAERDLAFLERPPPIYARGGISHAQRATRAGARLEVAARLDPGALERLDRDRARLLAPGAPGRAASLERLLATRPDDPWGCVLQAEERLAARDPAGAEAALARSGPLPCAPTLHRRAATAGGRALLAQGRASEALAALAAWLDPLDAEQVALRCEALQSAGRAQEAGALLEHLALLRGAHRQAAQDLALAGQELVRRESDVEKVLETFRRASELDPYSPFAAFWYAQARYSTGERLEGLAACVPPVARAPWLQDDMISSLMVLLYARRTVDQELAPWLAMWDDSLDGRLGRAFMLTALVEFDRRDDLLVPALTHVERLVRDDPGLLAIYTLRGFLHLRAGRLDHAARDLELSREGCPESYTRLFYEALLLAARREPRDEVIEALLRANKAGFGLWMRKREMTGWKLTDYPEVARIPDLLAQARRRAPRGLGLRPSPERWW